MVGLLFQGHVVESPRLLRSFSGRNIEQMPLLRSGKDEKGNVVDVPRTPITPQQLLYERVHGKNEDVTGLLTDKYVDTACGLFVDPMGSGAIKVGSYGIPVVYGVINQLNLMSLLEDGSLRITAEFYESIPKKDAYFISADAANALRQNPYAELKVREGFWEYVAEWNTQLVQEYLKLVQSKVGGSMKDRMGLDLSPVQGMRLLGLRPVDIIGYANGGGGHLGSDLGHLVGKST